MQTHSSIPVGFCQCGCGQPTRIAPRNHKANGWVKGQPIRYVHGHHRRTPPPAPDLKRCAKCGVVKASSAFGIIGTGRKAGQPYSYCRECDSAIRRERYNPTEEQPERHRQASRLRYANNKEYFRQYYASRFAERPEVFRRYTQEARRRHPLRYKAHAAVALAVKHDDLPAAKTMVCEVCGEALAAHWHHHNGYAPECHLDVIAVCIECHGKAHRKE